MQLLTRVLAGLTILILLISSCKQGTEVQAPRLATGTPVDVTTISNGALTDEIELNATSSFILKTNAKATATGYLQHLRFREGDHVSKGEILYTIITKEARTIGNSINKLDTSFHFKGEINVLSPGSGYITQMGFQDGDYVQEGEQIATISDDKSFAFVLNVPFELTPLLRPNKNIRLELPTGEVLNGTLGKALPAVDPNSQTQGFLIQVNEGKMIPENLIAKVKLTRSSKAQALSLPKEAVLTDETQTEFWVMKLMNDSIAVKIPIVKGIETQTRVEILDPAFSTADRFLIKGNYGLPDTALVRVQH
ncbi:MAG: efflux RND transporter periplasmic adaptor subunit [Bacteroidetes bacterium]|nr:efflux RND transporter periplasmic adaptor subunit [Bacteroidota bacterium]